MILQSFPLVVDPYPHQREVLLELEKALADPEKKFIILRAPTGSGKSAIALTAALHTVAQGGSAHLLASHRFLQEQYQKEYANKGLRLLWGKANYPCGYAEKTRFKNMDGTAVNCEQCPASRRGKSFIREKCTSAGGTVGDLCPYTIAKREAQASKIALNNYASFLVHTEYRDTFKKRPLMIVDEAHLIADKVSSFVSVEVIVSDVLDKESRQSVPLGATAEKYLSWINRTLVPSLERKASQALVDAGYSANTPVEKVEKDFPLGAGSHTGLRETPQMAAIRLTKLLSRTYALTEHISKAPHNWVCYEHLTKRGSLDRLEFTPVVVGGLAHQYLFNYADKVILMSATLNHGPFLKDLAIRKSNVATYLDVPSVFPLDTRPLIADFCGSMSYKSKESTLPKVAAKVMEIMHRHSGEKGVIHTHSFQNAALLRDLLGEDFSEKIVWHEPGQKAEDVLEEYLSEEDTWLASPSVTEGLDGKGDDVRVQIIIKAPYPSLADPKVKKRMEAKDGSAWYSVEASNRLIQAYGRGTRSPDDYSVTYLLDSGITRVINNSSKYSPSWVKRAWRYSHQNNWRWDKATRRWQLS